MFKPDKLKRKNQKLTDFPLKMQFWPDFEMFIFRQNIYWILMPRKKEIPKDNAFRFPYPVSQRIFWIPEDNWS